MDREAAVRLTHRCLARPCFYHVLRARAGERLSPRPLDLHLVPLGPSLLSHLFGAAPSPQRRCAESAQLSRMHALAATAKPKEDADGNINGIVIRSNLKSQFRDLEFTTITLSLASHVYDPKKPNYAGFILYGYYSDTGTVLDDWELNGIHCKSACLVVQNTDSPDVERYAKRAPGVVHGAIYWNMFGEGADTSRAIGEGFSMMKGKCGWNSGVFNAPSPRRPTNPYHNGMREISELGKICVGKILEDWMKLKKSELGKTYSVQELLKEE